MAILDALQLEKESLLGQVQTLNHRLGDERSKADALSEQIRKLNIRHNRLEFKYSKCQIALSYAYVWKLFFFFADECLKEQNLTKERNRRSQRIATYVRSSTAITSTPAAGAEGAAAAPHAAAPSTPLMAIESMCSFQVNYEIADLRNKLVLNIIVKLHIVQVKKAQFCVRQARCGYRTHCAARRDRR